MEMVFFIFHTALHRLHPLSSTYDNKGICFSVDLWYNKYIYDFKEARAMTFIKILFTILVCVPLLGLAGWMFGKLADEVIKKKQQ